MKRIYFSLIILLMIAGLVRAFPPAPPNTSTGDMAAATYDADSDDVVDSAATVTTAVDLVSSGVAHGMTDTGMATNEWFKVGVDNASTGGAVVDGATDVDGTSPMVIRGFMGSTDPDDDIGAVAIYGYKKNTGALVTTLGADETIFQVFNGSGVKLAIHGDGDTTLSGTFTATALAGNVTGNADTATALATLGTANQLYGMDSGGTAGEWKSTINILMDDSAAQFKSATASKGTAKVLLSGSTDGKLMTIALTQTDNRTVTFPDGTGTLAIVPLAPVIGDADDFDDNFTGLNLYGGTYIVSVAGSILLANSAVGVNFTILLEDAVATIIEPLATGTDDTIVLNGTALAQGASIQSSTKGAMCIMQYRAADSWMATCNGFVVTP